MSWRKLGLVFNIKEHDVPWLKSHAMMPLPVTLEDRVRVYYTGRHNDGRSRVSYFDLDITNLNNVINICEEPLLEVGAPGTFDDCGTVGTYAMKNGEDIWLYYNGYNVRNTVPWSNAIGLARSKDGGKTFSKEFVGPIVDRNKIDPYYTISPSVLKVDGKWHMWYTSGSEWLNINDKLEPTYNIKYAWSENGIDWIRTNEVCIEQRNREECVARASVLQEGDKLKMWFIYRGSQDFRDGVDSYRIGYAEANISNPTDWVRKDDEVGIAPGPEKFDDKMQAYAAITVINGKKHLFYNGNGFGYEGVCAAVWE